MITSFKNKDYSYTSRLLVLPVAFVLFCAFTLYTEKLPERNFKSVVVEQKESAFQDTSKPKTKKTKKELYAGLIFTKTEVSNSYPGGQAAWERFLLKNVKYPKQAAEKNIEGVVEVQFVIDEIGHISNIEIREGPQELRAEAVRLIQLSDRWTPASQDGVLVKSYRRERITFNLKNANATSFNYFKDGEPGGYFKDDPGKLYREEQRTPKKDESGKVHYSDQPKLFNDSSRKFFSGDSMKFYEDLSKFYYKIDKEQIRNYLNKALKVDSNKLFFDNKLYWPSNEENPEKTFQPKPAKESASAYSSYYNGPEKTTNPSFNYSGNKNKTTSKSEKELKKSPAKVSYEWGSDKENSPNSNINNPKTTPFKYEKEPTKNKKSGKSYPIEPIEKTYNKVDPEGPK